MVAGMFCPCVWLEEFSREVPGEQRVFRKSRLFEQLGGGHFTACVRVGKYTDPRSVGAFLRDNVLM